MLCIISMDSQTFSNRLISIRNDPKIDHDDWEKQIHDMQLNLIFVSFKQPEFVFYIETNHLKFSYIHMYKQTNILRDHISKITLKKDPNLVLDY